MDDESTAMSPELKALIDAALAMSEAPSFSEQTGRCHDQLRRAAHEYREAAATKPPRFDWFLHIVHRPGEIIRPVWMAERPSQFRSYARQKDGEWWSCSIIPVEVAP